MKLTKKTVKQEVETSEVVCEITQDEFTQICAVTSAETVVETLGTNLDIDDMVAGIAMTSLLADFVAHLEAKLFNTNKTENTHNNEKEEK